MNTTTAPTDFELVENIRRLFAQYLQVFPQEHQRLALVSSLLAEATEQVCLRHNLPGHLTASALIVDTQREAALLIHHRFLQRWLQPGGHLEPGELPLAGARREVREETGIDNIALHPWHNASLVPLDIDSHAIPANQDKGEPPHHHHDFLYVFARPSALELELQDAEVSSFCWAALADLRSRRYGDRLARVANKLACLEQGTHPV